MGIPKTRRSGGPRSLQGKVSASRNAIKTGVAATGWYHPQEEAEYRELFSALLQQYPQATPVVTLLAERLATNWVKLRRLERIDNALHQKARLYAEDWAREWPDISAAKLLPDTPHGRASAATIVGDAAMPPAEASNSIERGRITLERQIVRLIEQIEKLYAPAPASASAGRLLLAGQAEAQADISDATIVPAPSETEPPTAVSTRARRR